MFKLLIKLSINGIIWFWYVHSTYFKSTKYFRVSNEIIVKDSPLEIVNSPIDFYVSMLARIMLYPVL